MYRDEIEIILKIDNVQNLGYDEINKILTDKYHFDICFDRESEIPDGIFYNADLRSHMGYLIEEIYDKGLRLIIWPKYYKKGWEETYWKQLMEDCEVLDNV